MIKITTDKKVREEIEREMRYRDDMRWQNERIGRLEMRISKLERRLDRLGPPTPVNDEPVVMPKF